jgi:hypothetical protein
MHSITPDTGIFLLTAMRTSNLTIQSILYYLVLGPALYDERSRRKRRRLNNGTGMPTGTRDDTMGLICPWGKNIQKQKF